MALPDALLHTLRTKKGILWVNPEYRPDSQGNGPADQTPQDAQARLLRHRAVLARVFPELQASDGVVDSPLTAIPTLQCALDSHARAGQWFLKGDHALPVAGSVKARGGFHEVLSLAERLLARYAARPDGSVHELDSAEARTLFSRYTVAVGSTGNLGLGIGTISAALGFRAVVHMSADAKQWKKDRLRQRGTEVVEHAGDYARAVEAGRQVAEADPNAYLY